jgi:IS30 family transposase
MSFAHLNQHQRYQIEKQLAEGKSVAVIARSLGIHRSTVYRELRRGQIKGRYCASTSHQRTLGAVRRAQRTIVSTRASSGNGSEANSNRNGHRNRSVVA